MSIPTIGVLLVHGIGEQGRYQHLESEARNIAAAIERRPDVLRVAIEVNQPRQGPYGTPVTTWSDEGRAPVRLAILMEDGSRRAIDLREVWWADLDEPTTLRGRFSFLNWLLSTWAARRYAQRQLGDFTELYDAWMKPPQTIGAGKLLFSRVRLYLLAVLFALVLLTLGLVQAVLTRLFGRPIELTGNLYAYLGDVKLYQQQRRITQGRLEDMDDAPRVSIRRRMVRALVEMALYHDDQGNRYERWYVLAHSLGTVVAFNGLMEPSMRLASYLDPELFSRLEQRGYVGEGEPKEGAWMAYGRPRRHPAIPLNAKIDRARLFKRLAGVLTYGSPLEKFARIWPAIVSVNADEGVLADKAMPCDWFNLVDPTDPVAEPIVSLGERFRPQNSDLRAKGIHLLSHIGYLARTRREGDLVDDVAAWVLHGDASALRARRPFGPLRRAWWIFLRYAAWWLLGVVSLLLLVLMLRSLEFVAVQFSILRWAAIVVGSIAALALVLGLVNAWRGPESPRARRAVSRRSSQLPS